MPDWTIEHWGMEEFDVQSVPFVAEAVAAKKWAFAADYIRVYALYNEGGVYLDSDVLVRQNMDFVLNNRAFSAMEFFPHHAEKAWEDGLVSEQGEKLVPNAIIHGIPREDQISPIVMAGIAEKYGFKYYDREQDLMKPFAVAVHRCNASWRQAQTPFSRFFNNLKTYVKRSLVSLGLRKEKAIERIK